MTMGITDHSDGNAIYVIAIAWGPGEASSALP
jgi:hypothetical protein